MISMQQVIDYSTQIFKCIEENNLEVTFFEIVTMIAFLQFRDYGVDVAVLECGLGGRLDATNICKSRVAAITSIGFDHCEILGNTLDAISYEKAGIIRPGLRHMVTGPTVPMQHVIKNCSETNTTIHQIALD